MHPPCISQGCGGGIGSGATGELKSSWPGAEAKATIEKENPNVTAIIVHPGTYTYFDFYCNRVWVKVDGKNNVRQVPHVG